MCDTISINSLISGGIGLIGVYIGYRLSLTNIKRQDSNKAADILAEELIKERRGPHPFTNIDFSLFKRVLTKREETRFDRCVEEYQQTKRKAEIKYDPNNTDLTHPSCCWYHDANPVVLAIDKLLKFTKRK
jgi:hypothetical protein